MKTTKLQEIIKSASRFKHYHTAKSYSGRTIKPSGVLLGDDHYYWVLPMCHGDGGVLTQPVPVTYLAAFAV